MFYLTTHSIHLRLYGVERIVKFRSDSERKPATTTTRATVSISSNGSFICSHDNSNCGECYTSRGALVGTRNS